MSNVLNRDTLEFRRSVHAPDFSDPPWLHNPDLSSVDGVDPKYWKLTGDVLSEMSQAEKDVVDAAFLQAESDSEKAHIDEQRILKAFALIVLDEINLHAARVTAILDAIDAAASLAAVKSAVALIEDIPQRTAEQLVTAIKNRVDEV